MTTPVPFANGASRPRRRAAAILLKIVAGNKLGGPGTWRGLAAVRQKGAMNVQTCHNGGQPQGLDAVD